MGRLIYSAIMSLDGYIEDEGGSFDWAAPAEDVHGFANELMQPVGTHLLGRRMYEVMQAWENPALIGDAPPWRQIVVLMVLTLSLLAMSIIVLRWREFSAAAESDV